MTPEAQRIAIAEACPHVARIEYAGETPILGWIGRPLTEAFDPLNDLNAMHEAEKVLTEDQQSTYQVGLANLVARSPFDTYGHWSDVGSVFAVHATAAQRAEAFLRTLSLWKEDEAPRLQSTQRHA